MGTRETQRLAWREAVARAAACLRATEDDPDFDASDDGCLHSMWCYRKALREALSAPKPWTRPAKADRGGWMLLTKCGVDDTEPCGACLREAGEALRRKRRAAQRGRR